MLKCSSDTKFPAKTCLPNVGAVVHLVGSSTGAIAAVLLALLMLVGRGFADPFICHNGDDRLTYVVEHAEAVLFVEQVSPAAPEGVRAPTTYRVLDILKDERGLGEVGDDIRVDFRTSDAQGTTGLLLDWETNKWYWFSPRRLSRDGLEYVRNLPPDSRPDEERLAYFRRFLGHSDPTVAADAMKEFTRVQISVAAAAIDDETRSRLRILVHSNVTADRGFFAELLGLTGNDDDRQLLRELALKKITEHRPEAAGVMSGYLVLAGESGLQELEQSKLAPADIVFSERWAAMRAILFCHENAPQRIPSARLGQALQILQDRPDFCDLVLLQLRKMNDWSAVATISQLYETDDLRQRSNVRAMIRYVHSAAHPEFAEHVKPTAVQQKQAAHQLEIFRNREPKWFAEAMRFIPSRKVAPLKGGD